MRWVMLHQLLLPVEPVCWDEDCCMVYQLLATVFEDLELPQLCIQDVHHFSKLHVANLQMMQFQLELEMFQNFRGCV